MDEGTLGFIVWAVIGLLFVAIGIFAFFARKATGFWANAKMFEVENVKGYNRAMGKLWIFYGTGFVLLGLPLLYGQNSPFILLTLIGVLLETIALMCVYTLVIEKKYRRNK